MMRNTILVITFVLVASAASRSQTNPPIRNWDPPHNCSELKIVGPEDPVVVGVPVKLELKVVGGPEDQRLKYSWEVSDGTISSGQGTPVITVETYTLADKSASAITATVMVRGVPPECSMEAKYKIQIQRAEAQSEEPFRCGLGPTISVSCPTDVIQPGGQATVSGSIAGGDPNAEYTYKWDVSAGKIVAGQGTSTITIEVADETTTATLTAGGKGIPAESNHTASCTFSVYREPPPPQKLATYSDIDRNDERQHLTAFTHALEIRFGAQGYIFVYQKPGETNVSVTRRIDRIRAFLEGPKKMVPGQIVIINGGYRIASETELWIVEQGSIPPPATPTLDPPSQ